MQGKARVMYNKEQVVNKAVELGYTHILTDGGPVSLDSWEPQNQISRGFTITSGETCHIIEDATGSWLLIASSEPKFKINRSQNVSRRATQVKASSAIANSEKEAPAKAQSPKTYRTKSRSILNRTTISLLVLVIVSAPFLLKPQFLETCSSYIAKAGTLVFIK
jgi:hypothetical protein